MKRIIAAIAAVLTFLGGVVAVDAVVGVAPVSALSCSYSTSNRFAIGVSCTSGTYRIKAWCHNTTQGTSATVWGPIRSNGVWSFANCPYINGYTTWWYAYQLITY